MFGCLGGGKGKKKAYKKKNIPEVARSYCWELINETFPYQSSHGTIVYLPTLDVYGKYTSPMDDMGLSLVKAFSQPTQATAQPNLDQFPR